MNTIDSMPFAALSLLPIIFFLVWLVVVLGVLIFAVVMIIRFVRAHERIGKNLEAIALRLPVETKEKLPPVAPEPTPAPAPRIPSTPSNFSPPN